jgi:hypothetical protein
VASVGGHVICSAGFAPRLKRVRIAKDAAKGLDRCALSDDAARFAVVASRVTTRARWAVGQLRSSAPEIPSTSVALLAQNADAKPPMTGSMKVAA